MVLQKIFFKLGPVWNATLNPKFCISFLISGPIFGIQEEVIVWFLSVLLLLSLLSLSAFVSKLLIIFCSVSLSRPFLSVRYSISAIKYFSERILVALARNSLNILVIVSGGIQECSLIFMFVRTALRWTSNSNLSLLFFLSQESLIFFLHFYLLW